MFRPNTNSALYHFHFKLKGTFIVLQFKRDWKHQSCLWYEVPLAWHLQLAPSAEYLRLQEAQRVCVSVFLYVRRVEPPDYTTCASLCQKLNVCRALFLFGTWSTVSRLVAANVFLIIHHVLLMNLRACDLPAAKTAWRCRKKEKLVCNITTF